MSINARAFPWEGIGFPIWTFELAAKNAKSRKSGAASFFSSLSFFAAISLLVVDALENATTDIGALVERWPDVALWRLWEVVVEASVAEALLLADDQGKALEHVANSVSAFEQICKNDACRAKHADELPAIQRVLVQFARKVDSLVLEARLMVTPGS